MTSLGHFPAGLSPTLQPFTPGGLRLAFTPPMVPRRVGMCLRIAGQALPWLKTNSSSTSCWPCGIVCQTFAWSCSTPARHVPRCATRCCRGSNSSPWAGRSPTDTCSSASLLSTSTNAARSSTPAAPRATQRASCLVTTTSPGRLPQQKRRLDTSPPAKTPSATSPSATLQPRCWTFTAPFTLAGRCGLHSRMLSRVRLETRSRKCTQRHFLASQGCGRRSWQGCRLWAGMPLHPSACLPLGPRALVSVETRLCNKGGQCLGAGTWPASLCSAGSGRPLGWTGAEFVSLALHPSARKRRNTLPASTFRCSSCTG
eukprot:m.59649 g.59649  ORF g.59649 m.59649 type:complete len:314 (-) comp13007_c0_seq2:1018-1959(-)